MIYLKREILIRYRYKVDVDKMDADDHEEDLEDDFI
jgi:hypothetical protein